MKEVRTLEVISEIGLHCRPSASFAKTANQFTSDILVEKDGEIVNGKSIVGLLTLGAGQGSKLHVTAVGPDAKSALDVLETLVLNDFRIQQ